MCTCVCVCVSVGVPGVGCSTGVVWNSGGAGAPGGVELLGWVSPEVTQGEGRQ